MVLVIVLVINRTHSNMVSYDHVRNGIHQSYQGIQSINGPGVYILDICLYYLVNYPQGRV